MHPALGRATRNRTLAAGIVIVLVLMVGGECIALAREDPGPRAPVATTRVARRFAIAVTSFDYRRLDADVSRVLAFGSPGFERDFRAAMGPDFTKRIAAAKSISQGAIVAGPGVQRVRRGIASLFVVVNQRISSDTAGSTPRVLRVGLLIDVDQATGKVASVQVL